MNTHQPRHLALFFVCCVSAISASVHAAQVNDKTQPAIQIVTEVNPKPNIRLDAKAKTLGQILDELANKTGTLIHYSQLSDTPVTIACTGEDVGKILDCLVDKQFSMASKPAENNKPAEFWLVGTCVENCQVTAIDPAHQQNGKDDKAGRAMTDKLLQEQSDELLKQARSKDPAERSLALYNLGLAGQQDDPNVDETLHQALQDKDAAIRAQAVSSIAQRGGEAASAHLQQALQDKNVNVRLTAVNSINDDEDLLQIASGDRNKSVREIAKSKLEKLAEQQN